MKNGSKIPIHRFGKGTLKYGLGSFIKNIATKVNTVIPSVTPYTTAILRRLGLYDPHEGQSKHILNLTGKKMAVVTKDTPDVESVLGNEFIEENNTNTVNTVSEFKKMPYNTVLGDGTMKLGDIRVFYGINPETQTFNIGPLDSLPNYLTVIPVRNKGAMLVDSIVPGFFIDDKTKKYLYKENWKLRNARRRELANYKTKALQYLRNDLGIVNYKEYNKFPYSWLFDDWDIYKK